MSFPAPAAPPYLVRWFLESRLQTTAFEVQFYLRDSFNTILTAMTAARAGLTVYMGLMVADIHCLKIGVYNNDPSLLRDGYINWPAWGEFSGLYVPTVGADLAPLDYETGIQTRWQNLVNGVHETRHVRPLPRTLVTDGITLEPDDAYTAAMSDWNDWVVANAQLVTKSPGGTALKSLVGEVAENYRVVRVPGGEPHFMERGRDRSHTIVPA